MPEEELPHQRLALARFHAWAKLLSRHPALTMEERCGTDRLKSILENSQIA